jgi:hypothetical protein
MRPPVALPLADMIALGQRDRVGRIDGCASPTMCAPSRR